ncbi:MAG: TetR/AcrR family transcriptional regulator [Hespellia sp.]|nr:TetR/AcrR family transcriptional regulator [Hespellia sp.]
MGKVDDNKQQKLESLFRSAYDLFLNQGIAKTSVHDIVQKAGVAKGTFYLYFKDKYEIRDRLIAKTAQKLFQDAHRALLKQNIPDFEDRVIFVVDYVLKEMNKSQPILRFISKNLSWGIFRQALERTGEGHLSTASNFTELLMPKNAPVKLKEPEIMLFLIIELASSASFSVILENDPVRFEELKPYLYESIRAIIRNHIVL